MSLWECFGFPLIAFVAGLCIAQSSTASSFQWLPTGSLNTERSSHTATLLSDGRVLVAGGTNTLGGESLASAELYDPATGTWSFTGNLNFARVAPATLLADGRVLVAGGSGNSTGYLASSELYDPATGKWTLTGRLNTGRSAHTATLLSDGRVLVAGGLNFNVDRRHPLASAELYDPATGNWTTTGSLNDARYGYTATLLPSGKVLVAGGLGVSGVLESAELYDPVTGTWTMTGSLNTGRDNHTATLLSDGRVLVAGGVYSTDYLTSAELYDPATGTWTVTGSLSTGREDHTATLLTTGEVLVAGGFDDGNSLAGAELYDPAMGTWTPTGRLETARDRHTATLLQNGLLLVAGGLDFPQTIPNAELYGPITVDGHGAFESNGGEVTIRFQAMQPSESRILGFFSFCDPAAGVCVTNGRIQNLKAYEHTSRFSGSAVLEDRTKVTFSASVTDNGSPGTSDTISITLNSGYSAGGTLTSGDIRIY